MKKILVSTFLVLIFIIVFFLIDFYDLMQMFEIQSEDKATIIGGILSMFGGIVGALGAYFVASMQIKKQFSKQDTDRVIELRILKLNETLEITNEFLHTLQVWQGLTSNIELKVREVKLKGNTHVNESDIFHDNDQEEIKTEIRNLVSIKNDLKKNKIFLSGISDLQDIYNLTSEVVDNNNKFLNFFNTFKSKKSIEIKKLGTEFDEVIIRVNDTNNKLESEIQKVINLTENKIKNLLNM